MNPTTTKKGLISEDHSFHSVQGASCVGRMEGHFPSSSSRPHVPSHPRSASTASPLSLFASTHEPYPSDPVPHLLSLPSQQHCTPALLPALPCLYVP
ncbi:hypothetical protein E2C01_100185 [Portunus trituberculatus]|uniref:Uncharacterized protein n=1 Tax=Portunus trituberculatus TaxID=210409 RepID=A0A5B7K2C6_PORTR|nr:hypothetical protein [Portunus trituberculatus]